MISIDNSTCQIVGLKPNDFILLRELMSYKLPPNYAYYSGGFNTKRYLMTKRGEFPTGLLYIFEAFCKQNNVAIIKKDQRIQPVSSKKFKLTLDYEPYHEQIDAASVAAKSHMGIITAPTGFGKSVIAALLINKLQVNTLVVVPNLSLKNQLIESLRRFYGRAAVGGYGKPIAVENVDALTSIKELAPYDCLIIDEAHHTGAKTYRDLNKKYWKNIYYRFFLTATPFRSITEEQMLMESITGKVIYELYYKTAVEKGYIVPIEAYYFELPKIQVLGETWRDVYNETVINNTQRNQLIASLMNNLKNAKTSTLCLVKEIQHGLNIQALVGAPFVKGENDDNKETLAAFNSQSITTLIGTNGVVGEGVDTKPAEFVIIAGLGKSKNQFMQQCGRGFRTFGNKTSCKVILFKDNSHKWLKNHYKEQCKFLLDEFGATPIRLEI